LNVTDRRTDGRLTVASPRSALASRGKKAKTLINKKPKLPAQQNERKSFKIIYLQHKLANYKLQKHN